MALGCNFNMNYLNKVEAIKSIMGKFRATTNDPTATREAKKKVL